jgi:hypothetical protein
VATNFPTALDTTSNLPDPGGADQLVNADPELRHGYQHTTANQAIRAIEEKIGINDSEDTDSIDYKIRKGSFIERTESVNTASLAAGASDDTKTLPFGKLHILRKIKVTFPARVRLYSSDAARDADAARVEGTYPTPGSGCLGEFITDTADQEIPVAPPVHLYNSEASFADLIYLHVVNKDASTRVINVEAKAVPVQGG